MERRVLYNVGQYMEECWLCHQRTHQARNCRKWGGHRVCEEHCLRCEYFLECLENAAKEKERRLASQAEK